MNKSASRRLNSERGGGVGGGPLSAPHLPNKETISLFKDSTRLSFNTCYSGQESCEVTYPASYYRAASHLRAVWLQNTAYFRAPECDFYFNSAEAVWSRCL